MASAEQPKCLMLGDSIMKQKNACGDITSLSLADYIIHTHMKYTFHFKVRKKLLGFRNSFIMVVFLKRVIFKDVWGQQMRQKNKCAAIYNIVSELPVFALAQ